jgi:hypothetical protein
MSQRLQKVVRPCPSWRGRHNQGPDSLPQSTAGLAEQTDAVMKQLCKTLDPAQVTSWSEPLLLVGPPGSGKSTCLEVALRRLSQRWVAGQSATCTCIPSLAPYHPSTPLHRAQGSLVRCLAVNELTTI